MIPGKFSSEGGYSSENFVQVCASFSVLIGSPIINSHFQFFKTPIHKYLEMLQKTHTDATIKVEFPCPKLNFNIPQRCERVYISLDSYM